MTTARIHDNDEIASVLEHYVNGARTGRGDDMRPAFHGDATIFGYIGADLFGGPIERLFEWNDANGAASGLAARIVSIDLAGTTATARIEIENWTGNRFTDLFTLLKVNGQWKIMNKVFHLHA